MLEISKSSVSVGGSVWKLRRDELSLTVCQSLLSSYRLPVMLMVFIFVIFINSKFHRVNSKVSEFLKCILKET